MKKLSGEEAARRLKEDPDGLFLDFVGVMELTKLSPHELLAELQAGRLKAVGHGPKPKTAQEMWDSATISCGEIMRWIMDRKLQ